MRIFRVEGHDRVGPYLGGRRHAKFYERHAARYEDAPYKYPSPWFDRGLRVLGDNERCAFISLDSLRTWFGPALKDLRADGFRVTEYEIRPSKVRVGRYQVAYEPDYAKPVAVYSWEEVYKRPR